eukprot:COSAG06_NODE_8357_length_2191_cov_36.212888_2_plen_81_part_00
MVCGVCVCGGGCAGGGTQLVSACGLSGETERESVSLSLSLSLFSLSLCVCVCVFGSAWMRTMCLAVERWLTLAGLLARLV